MKKLTILSFFLMLILNQVRSQSSYEIYDKISGTAVKVLNGAVLTRSIKTTNTDYSFALQVKNISAVKCVSRIRKYYVDTVQGTSNYFCWDGCYFKWVMVSNPVTIKPSEIFEGLDLHYNCAKLQGQTRMKYVVYNDANRNDSIGFDVIFISSITGIGETADAGAEVRGYPNPASSTVNFTDLDRFPFKVSLLKTLAIRPRIAGQPKISSSPEEKIEPVFMQPVRAAECHTGDKGIPCFIAAIEIGAVVGERLFKVYVFLLEVFNGKLPAFGSFHHLPCNILFDHGGGFGVQT